MNHSRAFASSVLLALLSLFILSGCGNSSGNNFVVTSDNIVANNNNNGAGGNNGGNNNGGVNLPVNLRTVDVTVNLPVGSQLDLSTTMLQSQLADVSVSADGTSTVALDENGRVLAILFDQNQEPVLMGFVTDQARELSVESTLEAALYFALGTVNLPDDIRDRYFAEIRSLPEFIQSLAQVEVLFQNDPSAFQSNDFQTALLALVDAVQSTRPINPRVAVEAGTRSGLSVAEKPGDSISVTNDFRRRTHVFVYKFSFKPTGATNETILINDFRAENPVPIADFPLGPVANFSDVIGTLQNVAAGLGIDFFSKESDPVQLPLEQTEELARYKIRVVGPSLTPTQLTAREEEVFRRLEYETFFFDMVLPVLMNAIGQDNFLEDAKGGANGARVEAILNTFTLLASALPGVEEAVQQGDYSKAARDFFNGIQMGLESQLFETFYNTLIDESVKSFEASGRAFSSAEVDRLKANSAAVFNAVKIADVILQVNDFLRITSGIVTARMLEEFDATATRNKVQLFPVDGLAIRGERYNLTVAIQDSDLAPGQSYEYRWSTSGNFGELNDRVANSGTSFTSSRDTVDYFSSNATSLPDDAMETVRVEVFVRQGLNSTFFGEDEVELSVKSLGFEIRPSGFTMEGGSSANLRVVQTDGVDPTTSNDFEYRFDWETPGSFGRFSNFSRFATRENSNSISYTCVEDEREGQETIAARVYVRPKGSDEAFSFLETVDANINIENDPLKFTFLVNKTTRSEFTASPDSSDSGTGIAVNQFVFSPVPNADRYTLRVLEWDPGNPISSFGQWDADNPDDLEEDGVYVHVGGFAGGSATRESFARTVALFESVVGLAEVTVFLKPPDN